MKIFACNNAVSTMQNVPDRPIPAEQWTMAGPIGLKCKNIKRNCFEVNFLSDNLTLLLFQVRVLRCFEYLEDIG